MEHRAASSKIMAAVTQEIAGEGLIFGFAPPPSTALESEAMSV